MLFHADRPHARTTPAMRDAEGFVQVQMTHIAAQITGTRQADHRIHVRAINVDLTTRLVGDLAHIYNRFLEHPVGRRVCDHAGR